MKEQWLSMAYRSVFLSAALSIGLGAAPQAHAYSAQITSDAASAVYLLDAAAPADSRLFPQATISTSHAVPLGVSHDTSISAGPTGGNYVATNGAYSARVDPGALHLSARSAVSIDYAPAANGVDRYLRAQDGGTVQASLADEVSFSLAGLAAATPFLMDVNLRVDGSFGMFGGAPGTPITPNAYASGLAQWGFDVLAPGGRPAGVASTVTNRFDDSARFGIRDDGSAFDEFSRYGYPKTVTVTMYARSGTLALVEIYATLGTGATADANYSPGAAGRVEAGVNGNLSDTIAWGGISGLRLLDGTPLALASLSAQSASGFDYTKAYVPAVPLPAAVWSMGGALALVRSLRRRRQTTSSPST
jgi:hypothetical protein